MALCTQADVEKKLQWDVTSEPDAVVTALIFDAQALIEAAIGRTVESAARSETFNGGGWSLFLRHWPVTAITSVTVDGTLLAGTAYTFYEYGKLVKSASGYQNWWQTSKLQGIDVVYTGGYSTGFSPEHDMALEHLGSLCAEVVARAFRKGADNAAIPAGASGQISSVSLAGSDSVTYTSDTATIGGGLTQFVYLEEDERNQLARYRRPRFGFA